MMQKKRRQKFQLHKGYLKGLFIVLAVGFMLLPRAGEAQSNQSPRFLQPTPIYAPYFDFEFQDNWVTNPPAQPPVNMWTSEVSRTWCHLPAVEAEAFFNGVTLGDDCTDYVTPMRGGRGNFAADAGLPGDQSLSPHQLIDVPFLYSPYCGLDLATLTPQNPLELGIGWDFDLQDNYTYTGCWGVDEPVAVPFVTRNPDNEEAVNVMLADSGSDWHNDSHDQVGFLGTAGADSMDPVNMSFELDFFPATEEGYIPISVASGYFYAKPPATASAAAGTPTTGLFQDQMLAWMKSPVAYRAWRKMVPPPDTVILTRRPNPTEPGNPEAAEGYVTFIRGQGMDVHDDCIQQNLSACTAECGGSLMSSICSSCLMAHPNEAAALNNCPRHIAYNESDRSRTFRLEGTSDPVFIGYLPNTMNRWHQDLGPFCESGIDCIPNKNCADFCATAGCGATCDDGCNLPVSCGPCPPSPPPGCVDNCDTDFCQDPANCDDSCVDCQTGNTVQCAACPSPPPGCINDCDATFCQSLSNCDDSCVDCQSGNTNDCGTCLAAIPGCHQDCDAYCSQNCNDSCTKCSDGSVVTCDCGPPPSSPPAGCRSDCDDQFCQDIGNCGDSCVDCESGKTNNCADCVQPPAGCISDCDTTFCQDVNNCGQSCIDCETGISTTCSACVPPPPNCEADCTSFCANSCSGTCTQCNGAVVSCTCLPPGTPPTNTEQDCIDKCSSKPDDLCEWPCVYDGGTYTCPSTCPSTTPPTPPNPTQPLPEPTPIPSDVTTEDCLDAADSCEAACACAKCPGNSTCESACETSNCDPSDVSFGTCAYDAIAAANIADQCTAMPPDQCPASGFQKEYPKTCQAWCTGCIACNDGYGPACPDVCGMYCGALENTSQFKTCAKNIEQLKGTDSMPCASLTYKDIDKAFEIYAAEWLDTAGDLVCSEAEATIPTDYDQTTGTGPGYTGEASTNTDDCAEICQLVGADPNRTATHAGITVSADKICETICKAWCGDNPQPPAHPSNDLAALYPLRPEQERDLATCLAVRGGFFTVQSLSDTSIAYVGDGYSNLEVDPKFDTAKHSLSGGWQKIILGYSPANYLRWNPCNIYPSYYYPIGNGALPAGLKRPPYTVLKSAYCNMQHDARLTQDASSGFQPGTFFVLNRGPISCWNDIDFRNPWNYGSSSLAPGAIKYPDGGMRPENFRMPKEPGNAGIFPHDDGEDSCGYITFYTVENTANGLQVNALQNANGDTLKVPTGLNPTFATVGDYNGDGSILDIAVTNVGSQNQGVNGSVSVMFCAPGPTANFQGGGSAAGPDLCPCGALIVDDTPFKTVGGSDDSVHPWALSSDVLMGKKVTYEDSNEVIADFNQGAFTPVTGEICNDSLDNDSDGLIDCFDPDCDTFCKSVIRAPEDLVVSFLDAYKSGHNDFAVLRNKINGANGTGVLIDPKNYVYNVDFSVDHYRDHEALSSQYNSPSLQDQPIKLLAKDYGAYPLGVESGFFGETSDYSLLPLGTGVWLENVIGYMFPGFTIADGGLTSPCSQLMIGFHNSRNVGRYHQIFPESINSQWGAWNNPQQTIERCTAEFTLDPEDVTDATTPIYNAASTGLGGQGLGWGPKALRGYYSNAYTERTYRPGGTDWFYVLQSTDPRALTQGQTTLNLDVELDFSRDLMGINGNTLNLYEYQFVDNNYAVASYLPDLNPACSANNFELFNLVQDTSDANPASNPCLSNQAAPPGLGAGPASYCSYMGDDPETPNRCYQRWGSENAAGYACCLILESPGVASEVQKINDSDLWPSSTACPFVDPMQCCIDQLNQQHFSIDAAHQVVNGYTYDGNQGCAPDCRDDLREQIDAAFAAQDWATQWDLTVQLNCTCMPNPTFMQQGLCGATTTFDCSTLGNATAIACCQDPNSSGCDPCSLAPDPDCCRDSAACPQQTPPPCSCNDLDASVQDCCVDQAGTQSYASCNELLGQIDFSQCVQQQPPTSCESTYSGDQTRIDCCNGDTDACCDLQPTADLRTCCHDSQDPVCTTLQQQTCSCEQFSGDLRACCIENFGSGDVDCMAMSGWNMADCLEAGPPTGQGLCDPNDANAVRAGFATDFQQCCQRYDGDLVMALSSGDADCPGGGTDGCNIDFTNNGVINGNVQICCECFNISGSHNDVSCTQSCATIYDPTPDPNFCLGKRALNQPVPVECTATCDEFPDSPICQQSGRSPKIFCDELLSWEDVTDWSNLENESKAKANLQGLCASASGNEKCLGLLLNGSGRLDFNVGSTLSLMGLSLDEVKGKDGVIEIYQTQGVAPESIDTDLAGLSFLTTEPGSVVSGMTQLVGGSTPISADMGLTMTWPYEQVEGEDALNKFQVKVAVAGEEIVCDVPPVLRALSVAGGESGATKGLCALIPNGTRGPVDFMAVLLLLGVVGTTTRWAYSRKRKGSFLQ